MGKASKWFRGLLGLKKQPHSPSTTTTTALKPSKEKRRWSLVKPSKEKEKDHQNATVDQYSGLVEDPNSDKNVLAVAAATAAMAEAAIAAAHAAATVARLTTTTTTTSTAGDTIIDERAAIKIQAAFRGHLARKALRALKGLVKLQALVRGHIERKRTADWLQKMQALLRAQARVRAGRAQIPHSSYWTANSSSGPLHVISPATPEKVESPIRSKSMKYDQSPSVLKRNSSKYHFQVNGNQEKYGSSSDSRVVEQSWNQRRSWVRTCSMDDETSVRILDIDSGKPQIPPSNTKRRNLFYSSGQALVSDYYYCSESLTPTKDTTSYHSGQSPSSCEVQSYNPLNINDFHENSFCAAEKNSPQILSTSSKDDGDGSNKRSPFTTPTLSDGTRSYLSGYSDYPSYMAYTESSKAKAKARSLSAPRQRPQFERCSSSNRYSNHHHHRFGESKLAAAARVSALHASFASKAYPGSGRLDKLGLPLGYRY